MNQQNYLDYLRYIYKKADGEKLSESSINHYAKEAMRLINNKLRKIINDEQFSIYDIDDIVELQRLRDILFSELDFSITDKDGHQMYSAGMNRYIEYAEGRLYKGMKDILPIFDKPEPICIDLPSMVKETKQRVVRTPDRNKIKIIQAEQAYNYTCQINPQHLTFIVDNTNHQYMEGHHIIPLSRQKCFQYNLDCYANILVLCPTCHRFFHYAEKRKREEKLKKIYADRAERLAHSGIILNEKEFLEIVDTKPSEKKYFYKS